MALISCPSCLHQISAQASACPNCGHPLLPITAGSVSNTDYTPSAPTTSTSAIVSLVFGLLAWFLLPVIGAAIAVIAGHIARAEIRRAPLNSMQGDGMAIAGLILGWAHLVIFALVLLVLFAVIGKSILNWH